MFWADFARLCPIKKHVLGRSCYMMSNKEQSNFRTEKWGRAKDKYTLTLFIFYLMWNYRILIKNIKPVCAYKGRSRLKFYGCLK